MPSTIKKEKFSRKVIYLLAQMSTMSESILSELYAIAGFKQDTRSWISFVSKCMLTLGLLFTLSGILFFFAYNWNELHKFAKLAIIYALILIPAAIALLSDLRKFHSKLSLLAVAFFIGCLLAVFGQIYQTGANAYDLFLNWAILITGIVLVSNFQPLWFMWLLLINTAIVLFAGQIVREWIDPYTFLTLFAVNAVALVIYEYFSAKKVLLFESRWLPRILGFTVAISSTVASIAGIFTDFENSGHTICLLTAILGYCGIFIFYTRKMYDLSSIAVSCMCIIALVFSIVLNNERDEELLTFLLGGIVIVTLTIVTTIVLIKINESWKKRV